MTSSSDALGASETKELCQNRQHVCRVEKGRGNKKKKKVACPFGKLLLKLSSLGQSCRPTNLLLQKRILCLGKCCLPVGQPVIMQGQQVFVEALGYRTALLLGPEGGTVLGRTLVLLKPFIQCTVQIRKGHLTIMTGIFVGMNVTCSNKPIPDKNGSCMEAINSPLKRAKG